MSEKNIVICDQEIKYAQNLMENIMERKEFAVKVYVCSTWENVEKLSREKTIHILIVDEECAKKDQSAVRAEQTVVLTTGGSVESYSNEKSVYKYQCVDQILSEIFETYFAKTKENMMKHLKKKSVKIVAVYSPIHRAGKTKLAVTLGKELAKTRKTLYLNLEEYFGFGEMFEKTAGGNLGDVLYYTKQENSNLGIRIGMLVKTIEELEYIPPMPVNLDLKEVTWEEWETLLKQIVENSLYEVILLDVGECVQGLFEMLRLCDRIYMPILEDAISQGKLRQYEEMLQKIQMDSLLEKTVTLVVPQDTESCVRQLLKEEKDDSNGGAI